QFLEEIGEDTERGWTIVENKSKALEWEKRVGQVGPVNARQWALKAGPKMLRDTEAARRAVAQYLIRLAPARSLDSVLLAIRNTAPPSIVDEVGRLSECPAAAGVPGTELAYEVATYTILQFSCEVENGSSFLGKNPEDNLELMQRIDILA